MNPRDETPETIPEVERLQTPALVIRLERVRANLGRISGLLGGRIERWRPHVKTAKVPDVLEELLAAGVRRFKCATTREAAVLLDVAARVGVEIDLLAAIALRGRNLVRFGELAAAHPDAALSVLTEDPAHAAALRRDLPALGLFIDLDPGFRRSGISRDRHERIEACVAAAGEAFRGLHDYEGHVRGTDPAERSAACAAVHAGLVRIAERLERDGRRPAELITSGTPTFLQALAYAPFARFDHQVSPGTLVYWDETSTSYGISGFVPAATVVSRIVSRPDPRRATCDAGSKAIDAACGIPCARVVGRPDLRARMPSEEHLPLVADGAHDAPAPGTLLELVPRHVCPTVNLATEAFVIDGTTTRRVPVAARGHEL